MESSSWLDGDDNWLEAAVVTCPSCGLRLFCLLHSPMCDDHRLYCERCPRAVEISFYDPVYEQIVNKLPDEYTWQQMAAIVAPLLKPCVCGGHYCGTDQRYCSSCHSLVPEAAGKDFSPYVGYEDTEREPTTTEQAESNRFELEFIKNEDLWVVPDHGL